MKVHYSIYGVIIITTIGSISGCANYIAGKVHASTDKNGDGIVTFAEYPRVDYNGKTRSQAETKAEFIKDDKNKDGVITKDEIYDSMLTTHK